MVDAEFVARVLGLGGWDEDSVLEGKPYSWVRRAEYLNLAHFKLVALELLALLRWNPGST